MAIKKMQIDKEFFNVNYTFHIEIERSDEDERLTLKDVTVKNQSIIRVMDPEILIEAKDEFTNRFLMQTT